MRRHKASAWHRTKHRVAHSIKLRMVMVFLLLAAAMTFVFVIGVQKAFTVGWREAARPILMDYVDHLAEQVTAGGPTPSVENAQAITERLPLTVRIDGPVIRWASHPDARPTNKEWGGGKDWPALLNRQSADGHRIEFGLNGEVFERRPRLVGYALGALLALTLMAWLYVSRLLRPLDAIGEGARRFGLGDFSQPIPERGRHGPDELGELAKTINTMGRDIHQMLESKRALLLAISHELRSPLTRARLNAELLPETDAIRPQRDALLRDVQGMASLISDLLESERLSGNHVVLQRTPTDVAALAREVAGELQASHAGTTRATVSAPEGMPMVSVDAARVRLLLRNLIDNALRHGGKAPVAPSVTISKSADALSIEVRDHGPGVPEEQLSQLAQAFYRPDSARTRSAGGVGLGLYLCRLMAQAHGGAFTVQNAHPGLSVTVTLAA